MNSTDVTTTEQLLNSVFNLEPGMGTYGIITLLACYSIVCLAILTLNYLIMRSFMTARALLPRQRIFLSYLASMDLAVGLVSMPAFMYNLYHWPNYMFYIYEALDCASGFAFGLVLVTLSIKMLRGMFRAPTQYAGHQRSNNFCLVMAGSALMALSMTALNLTCLMSYVPFVFFFYATAAILSAFVLIMAVTCIVVMTTIICGKDRETERDEDKNVRKLVLISCAVYIFTWALPYAFFVFNSFCEFCFPLPTLFFYIVRLILYLKSILVPIAYFRSIPLFNKVVKKILTRDCLARRRYRY